MLPILPGSGDAVTGRLARVTSVLWLRRDLRLDDHPALHAAGNDGPVLALFVLDPVLLRPAGPVLPDAGEQAARRAWQAYRRTRLAAYADDRDRPDLDHTSRISPYLKWGAIHPRTLLADLGPADETFRRELAWREFYATVL